MACRAKLMHLEGHKIILYSSQISVSCSRKCSTVDFCTSILNRVKHLLNGGMEEIA